MRHCFSFQEKKNSFTRERKVITFFGNNVVGPNIEFCHEMIIKTDRTLITKESNIIIFFKRYYN